MSEIKQKILDKTNGGYDVFVKFFGKQCKRHSFLNIYRDDNRRSCTLYEKGGKWSLKDFGDSSWSGDCFHVVALIQNLNLQTQFMDVLKVIDKECNLCVFLDDFLYQSNRRDGLKGDTFKSYSKVKSFTPSYKDFTAAEEKFWLRYGIGLDILRRFNVRSLYSCTFVREDGTSFIVSNSYQFPLFGYMFADGDIQPIGIKTYQPGAAQRFLRAGKLPSPYLFGRDHLAPEGKVLFITGGEKDVLSLSAHGFSAICYNSETARVPSLHLDEYLQRFSYIVYLYDMDETGIKERKLRVTEAVQKSPAYQSRVLYGVLPLSGSKQDKDVSDYFAKGFDGEAFCRDLTVCDYHDNVLDHIKA